MKKFLNKFVITPILITLFFNNTTIFANDIANKNEDKLLNEVINYSSSLAEILYVVNNIYLNEVDNNKAIEGAIEGIINSLGDEHSVYYTKEEYENFLTTLKQEEFNIGFIYKVDEQGYVIVDEILPNSYAEKFGMKKDDKILNINGKKATIDNLQALVYENINNQVYNLGFDIIRDNIKKNIVIQINESDLKTVIYKDINEFENIQNTKKDVCYIRISNISDNTEKEFLESLKKANENGKEKLILDLRGNTGGYFETAINICKSIIPKGTIVSTKDKNGKIEVFKSELENPPFKQIAVLTDSLTASSAEIIASAIKDSEIGFTVGQRTYGKGTIQKVFEIYTGGAIKLTTKEYFSRNGNKINNIGISPTFLVSPVLFIDENIDINSKRFKEVLDYINLPNLSLSEIQKNNGIKVTNKLDKEIIDFINEEIYKTSILKDEVLLKAYNEIIK